MNIMNIHRDILIIIFIYCGFISRKYLLQVNKYFYILLNNVIYYQNLSHNDKMNMINKCCKKNKYDILLIISNSLNLGYIFSNIIYTNNIDILEIIIKDGKLDITINNNLFFREAVCRGQIKQVKLLLEDKRVDPSELSSEALCQACEMGYTDIVKLLLKDKRSDPTILNNYPLIAAVKYNFIEIVKLLLKDGRINRSDRNFRCYINKIVAIHSETKQWETTKINKRKIMIMLNNYFKNRRIIK